MRSPERKFESAILKKAAEESAFKRTTGLKMSKEDKGFLLSKVPEIDIEERKALFKALLDIKFLNLKREKAIGFVKKFW